jgi:ArsR family transcriptional regulator, arsenate/arsenite/antimonite-responsive transcriptional repressor
VCRAGNAGLIDSRRDGRSVIYSRQYDAMTGLLEYLMEDCCGGVPEICAALAEVVMRSQCLTGTKA